MFWQKITLDGYIPFTHVGNKHVEIEFDSPVTAILGSNGCGKSSLLRIMDGGTPPVRTDFLKDGKVEMVLTHDGHIYTLTSNFEKKDSPHSFKKDGVELNLSGTSETQKDLAYENFGITSLINDLMAGNIKVCSMQKALRKQLFSATYPSDLSFILEYHKKVCSQIRTFSNQIKLLQTREGSLMTLLLDAAEQKRLTEWSKTAQDIITRIDKINILLENEVNQLKSHPALQENYDLGRLDDFENTLNGYVRTYKNYLLDYSKGKRFGESITKESVNGLCVKLQHELQFLEEKRAAIVINLQSIRDELDKFIKIKNTSSSDEKDALIDELKLLDKNVEELKSDPDWCESPSIAKERMDSVEAVIPEIERLIAVLHPLTGSLIGQEEIVRLRTENDQIRFAINSLISEKTGIDAQLTQNKSRKDMLTQNSYPKDCIRVCGLRATVEASVRDIDLRCSELETRKKKIDEDMKHYASVLESNQNILQLVTPVLPTMKALWDKLSENYLLELALDGQNFIDCLNTSCSEILNRVVKGYRTSKIYHRYKEISDRIHVITNTIDIIETNSNTALSEKVINEIISRKRDQLEIGIKELEDLETLMNKKTVDLRDSMKLDLNLGCIDTAIEEVNKALNASIILNRIEFDEKILSEHNEVRRVISSKLREVEHTLSEQKRITDVLDTEIRPTLNDLRNQKSDWEIVEKGLNPNSGLPCIYLIRFINRLISRVNAIIEDVWYSDMELAYLEEKDNLDFSLKVIFNKSTTAKDISLCSAAQQTLINIAFMLAIAIERGFIDWLPIRLDESDAPFTEEHRAKLIDMLSRMIENQVIKQMMIVSHFAAQSGIPRCSNVVLSTDGIVCPPKFNEHVVIS